MEGCDPARSARSITWPPPLGRAVPALIEALQDPETAVMAVRVLARIGPDAKAAVPSLAEVLRNERTRADAVKTLVSLGPQAVSEASSKMGEDLRSIDKWEYTAGIVDGAPRAGSRSLARCGRAARGAAEAPGQHVEASGGGKLGEARSRRPRPQYRR
jgi:hypothetical protein